MPSKIVLNFVSVAALELLTTLSLAWDESFLFFLLILCDWIIEGVINRYNVFFIHFWRDWLTDCTVVLSGLFIVHFGVGPVLIAVRSVLNWLLPAGALIATLAVGVGLLSGCSSLSNYLLFWFGMVTTAVLVVRQVVKEGWVVKGTLTERIVSIQMRQTERWLTFKSAARLFS